MYLNHFKLNTKPFQITSDPKFLWLGEKHKEALATLRYGILDNRGFLLLTGEVGTGKTILINRLITMLDLDTVVATLPDPDLESMDFYNLLADGFKMNRTFESKGTFLIHLREFLYKSYTSKKQVLLVIDESQRLNHHLMEDIRVLSNIELHDRKLINIFFVGQQEFNTILAAPQNRALAQRITVRYHIAPLEKNEIGEYIHHRLQVAGCTQKLFTDEAVEEVYQFSGGIPRLINIICDHAMLTGYARESKKIDANIIKECAQELRIPLRQSTENLVNPAAVPDSRSIATAAKKEAQAANQKESAESQPAKNTSGTDAPAQTLPPMRSPFLKLLYAGIVLILVLMGGFAITQISSPDKPRWDADALTPDKYKTSLEKEKEILAERMKQSLEGDEAPASPAVENQVASPSAGTSRPTAPPATPVDKQVASPSAAIHRPMFPPVRAADKQDASPRAAVSRAPVSPERKEPVSAGLGPSSHSGKSGSDPADKLKAIEPLPLMKEKVTIHFKLNSNEIEDQSYGVLDRIATYLVQHPNEAINVRGFTDSSGSSSYNESVSRFRASAVKSYLVGKGVLSDRIQTFAMGDAFPISNNETLQGRSQNRRVEIEFVRNPAQN